MLKTLIQIQGIHAAIGAGLISYGTGMALVAALTSLEKGGE